MVAKTVGTGIVRENQVAIQVGAIGASGDAWYQPEKQVTLERSDSMAEMVANINAAFYDNEVVATINDDGKLVLSNDDGATIRVADISGTDNAYDGATGFLVTTDVTFTSESRRIRYRCPGLPEAVLDRREPDRDRGG